MNKVDGRGSDFSSAKWRYFPTRELICPHWPHAPAHLSFLSGTEQESKWDPALWWWPTLGVCGPGLHSWFNGPSQLVTGSWESLAVIDCLLCNSHQHCPSDCLLSCPGVSGEPGVVASVWDVCMCVQSLSQVWLFVTPWTVTRQSPLPMGFLRQEYWSGLPFPSPGDLPGPGIEPESPAPPALQADSLLLS